MNLPAPTLLAFALLAFAILAVWLKPLRIGERVVIAPWTVFFIAAIACGLAAGVLRLPALVSLAAFGGAAYVASTSKPKSLQSYFFGVCTALLALGLALHRLPGFNNPLIIADMTLSAGAAAFSQYANFDKGSAGLILLALLCRRAETAPEWRRLFKQTWPVALVTVAVVLGLATCIGYVKPDIKFAQVSALFLATNLLFTVVAEEAFFRGLLQDRLALSLANLRFGRPAAIVCSALLFGAAHAAGGGIYVMLATLAGLGYAYAYHLTRRIEAAIFVHFAVNAVHFVGFTYPHLN